jgi:electron transport complex protein RnfB
MSGPGDVSRRDLFKFGLRGLGVLAATAGVAAAAHGLPKPDRVWQIDPHKCTQCGRCAKLCVLTPSAVKCVHAYAVCGYCDLCTGFFEAQANALDTGAENQLCPTDAIRRRFVEDPYFSYTIDEAACIGCARCVKGCGAYGNGSLFLQIRHDRCVNCNQCAIASACPAQAIARVPADQPYIIKSKPGKA